MLLNVHKKEQNICKQKLKHGQLSNEKEQKNKSLFD